jgi:RimJ/RimL family protein N-acetyltransferase
VKLNYLFEFAQLGFQPVNEYDLNYLLKLTLINNPNLSREPKAYGFVSVTDLILGKIIGRAGLGDFGNGEIEVVFMVQHEFRGRGYGTKMLTGLLSWARSYVIRKKIISITAIDHHISQHVMQKAGMTLAARDPIEGILVYEYIL